MTDTLRALFDRHDTNRSGVIDVAELDALLRALGVRLDDDASGRSADASAVALARLRTASPGQVTFDELRAWWSEVGPSLRGRDDDLASASSDEPSSLSMGDDPHGVFASFDGDGSGYIERRELARILAALGMEPSSERVKQAMKKLDTDGDGRISSAEFATWWAALGR